MENYENLIKTAQFRYKYLECGVPPKFIDCTLENFDGFKLEETPGFIYGPVGTGKTHLAVGYLKQEAKRIYLEESKLTDSKFYEKREPEDRLKAVFNRIAYIQSWKFVQQMKELDQAREIQKKYEFFSFLVLDDVGTERQTEYSLDIISTLLYCRYDQTKKTLLTSNLELSELSKLLGERIASRLVDSGPILQLKGEDYRLRKRTHY